MIDDVAGEFGEFPMRTTDSFRSRGAGMGHPPRRPRHPFPLQVGGWGWEAGMRLSDRTAHRTHDRTHSHSGDPRFGRGTEFWCGIPSYAKISGLEAI